MTSIESRLSQALGGTKPVLVFFKNPTCPRCAEMTPVIEAAARALGDKADFVTVDTTADQEICRRYHVDSHPYYILFKEEQEVWRDGGRKPQSEIEDMVRRFI